jgi:preprotein translocase subunit YajC
MFLAQTTPVAVPASTTQPNTPPGWFDFVAGPMFPLVIGIIILYFFMNKSKKGQEKQRESMLSELKRGDRVQTIGGILGSVVEVRDNEVVVKVDETSNAKIKFTRSAIHRVVTEDKAGEK